MTDLSVVRRPMPRVFQQPVAPPAPREADLWSDAGSESFRVYFHGAWRALGLAGVVDVRTFMDTLGGTADVTPGLQAAVDAAVATGLPLYLPGDTYRVSAPISLPSNLVTLGSGTINPYGSSYFGALLSIPDGATNVLLGGSLTLDGLGKAGPLIQIGTGCTDIRVADEIRLRNPRVSAITAGPGCRNVDLGPHGVGVLDLDWLGANRETLILSQVSTTGGSRTATCEGGLRAEMVGWSFEVPEAGPADSYPAPNTGNQTWRGTVASVDTAANTFTATGTDPTASVTTSGLRGVVGYAMDQRFDDAQALTPNIGLVSYHMHAGKYYTKFGLNPPSGVMLSGDGPYQTWVRAGWHAPCVQFQGTDSTHLLSNSGVRDMWLQSYAPEGGADGLSTGLGCLDVKWAQRIWISNIRCSDGTTGIAIREDGTQDIFLRDILIHDMYSTNGKGDVANIMVNGIGLWLFSSVKRIHGTGITIRHTSRHGVFIDAGTTSQTVPGQHGFPTDIHLTDLVLEDTCYRTSGVALGFFGGRDCHVGTVSIRGTGPSGDGIDFGQDQNGEFAQRCTVGVATLKAISGVPVNFTSAEDCTIGVFDLEDFNLDQGVSYARPIIFNTSSSASDGVNNSGAPKASIPQHDCLNNRISVANIRYGVDLSLYRGNGGAIAVGVADPTMYDLSVSTAGGNAGTDGNAGTPAGSLRYGRTRGNGVEVLRSTPSPSNGLGSIAYSSTAVLVAGCGTVSGSPTITRTRGSTWVPFSASDIPNGTPISGTGIPASSTCRVVNADTLTIRNATDTADVNATATGTISLTVTLPPQLFNPSGGYQANYVGPARSRKGINAPVAAYSVYGEDYSRLEITTKGDLNWGGGAAASDINLTRPSAGVLWLSTVLFQIGEFQLRTGSFTVSANSDPNRTFLETAVDRIATLPAVTAAMAGYHLRFLVAASALSAGTGFQILPNAADKIMGNGITSLDGKKLINTGATDAEGDYVELVCDGADGWYVTAMRGAWAREA